MIRRCQPLLSLFLLLALLAPSWAWAAAQVTGLQLVSSARAGRTTFDYTYRITVLNGTPALSSALASVTSPVASTQVVKGSVLPSHGQCWQIPGSWCSMTVRSIARSWSPI